MVDLIARLLFVVLTLSFAAMGLAGEPEPSPTAVDEESVALLLRDVEAAKTAGDAQREAAAWRRLGESYYRADDFRQAVEAYEEALRQQRVLGELADPSVLADTLDRLVEAYRDTDGDQERSLALLAEALELRRRQGDPGRLAATRNSYCFQLQKLGRFRDAAPCYETALELARSAGDPKLEAQVLNNLGGIHANLGEPDRQVEYLNQALALHRRTGNEFGEAATLNNLGSFHRGLGEVDEAVFVLGEALDIFERLGHRYWLARTLNNLGFAYLDIGDLDRAQAYLLRAIPIRREVGDKAGEAVTLRNLGRTFEALGDRGKALAFFRKALDLAEERDDVRGLVTARKLLGGFFLESDPEQAASELAQALASARDMAHRHEQAEILCLLGRAQLASGDSDGAGESAAASLRLHRELLDPLGQVGALTLLARVARARGEEGSALAQLETALGVLESVDRRLGEASRRALFLASQRAIYEQTVDVLMARHLAQPDAGFEVKALEVSEQARSRALMALLDSEPSASELPTGLASRLRAAERLVSAKTQRQFEVLGDRPSAQDGADAEAERLEALADLESVRTEIRRIDPRDPASASVSAPAVADLRSLLDGDTVLLEFLLGEECGHLWWLTSGELSTHDLPPRTEIEALARKVHEGLATPGGPSTNQDLETLGRLLLDPVASRLQGQRLAVVADGALDLVPFAALGDPGAPVGVYQPLLLRHEVVELPSATVLAEQRQARSAGRLDSGNVVAILADPIFGRDDPRLDAASGGEAASVSDAATRGGSEFKALVRLPASREEAEAIAALAPDTGRLVALGASARRDLVVGGRLNAYRILHFATHGVLHPQVPELSGLVLSRFDSEGRPLDGFLSLQDVAGLDLSAQLVVLSGCHTALGKLVRGEGLVGLTRGFMYAGVPRVMASRWQVRDQATAELMTSFYRAVLVDGLNAAAALRAAQLSLREQRRYRDPYFWAAFSLQGDWR